MARAAIAIGSVYCRAATTAALKRSYDLLLTQTVAWLRAMRPPADSIRQCLQRRQPGNAYITVNGKTVVEREVGKAFSWLPSCCENADATIGNDVRGILVGGKPGQKAAIEIVSSSQTAANCRLLRRSVAVNGECSAGSGPRFLQRFPYNRHPIALIR